MRGLGRADDGRCYARPAGDPGEGHLRRLDAELGCHLLHPLDDGEIVRLEIHALGEIVDLGPHGLALLALGHAIAGKKAAGERAPWNDAHAFGPAEWDHLALFLAID